MALHCTHCTFFDWFEGHTKYFVSENVNAFPASHGLMGICSVDEVEVVDFNDSSTLLYVCT